MGGRRNKMTHTPAYTLGFNTQKDKPEYDGQLYSTALRKLRKGTKIHIHKITYEYDYNMQTIPRHVILPQIFIKMYKLYDVRTTQEIRAILCEQSSSHLGVYQLTDIGAIPFKYGKHKRWASDSWITLAKFNNTASVMKMKGETLL